MYIAPTRRSHRSTQPLAIALAQIGMPLLRASSAMAVLS
jgi:hypothetical protein